MSIRPEARVALVHDYWVAPRGGERVFMSLARLFPAAVCYVLIRSRSMPFAHPRGARLRTSALQMIPFGARYFRALLPLYPMAARSLDLSNYDLVISSSSGFSHGVRTSGTHVCYCHAPMRYAWNEYDAALAHARLPGAQAMLRKTLEYIRAMDTAAARRVTAYISNSAVVQRRIRAYYGRESVVVHPFVDLDQYRPSERVGNYLLVVSSLLPYKRVDLAVAACTRLGRPLVVVGEGPERARLEHIAGPTVRFLGRVNEAELPSLYANCAGLLQCQEEDFGIVALEAQASGRPVVAFGAGGALETVIDGITGVLFAEQSVEAVVAALECFDPTGFDPALARAQAERFDECAFHDGILRTVERAGRTGYGSVVRHSSTARSRAHRAG